MNTNETSWRTIKIWHLAIALHRGAIEWFNDERVCRAVLRSRRTGATYDYKWTPRGWLIRKRLDQLL